MKNILNLIRDLRAGKQGYHTESKYLASILHYTKVSMWNLNDILNIILDSKYIWNGRELPEKGSIVVTQEEGKILQGVLMMHGHYWIGPIRFKCRLQHNSEFPVYTLQWYYHHTLSWFDSYNYVGNRWDILYFSEFEENGTITLLDKYRGWKTGENYGI